MPLRLDEIERYQRQILLPEWGAAGQERVRDARVVVHGCGAAAATAARYLAGAGVGELHVERGDPGRVVVKSGDGPHFIVGCRGEREAVGAACALEAIKAILGLPHRSEVELPRLHDEPGAIAP